MSKSIKLNPDLWQRVTAYAAKAGYSSPEEFIQHAIEKELAHQQEESDKEEVERRLKGLGYID
jgi:metal-responsive CopG/Arc/MetJ family transcriptional regulator